jgi:isochorismate hydrolase
MSDILKSIQRYIRRPFDFSPKKSALLVIDMQDFFLHKQSHAYLPMAKKIIPNIQSLINAYHKSGLPVIFTRHALKRGENPGIMKRWWKDVVMDSDKISGITESLDILKNDYVIRKTRYSAFYRTQLEKILKRNKIERVVITGVLTHLCCETTARDAFLRDFEVFFVADATATDNMDLHLSSLKTLSDGFAIPVTTKYILCCSE